MALTEAQQKAREGKLTASRVACLMSGNERKILNLWRELVGSPDYEPEDLEWNWAVRLGQCTEDLNLDFYEHVTGHPVTRRRDPVTGDQEVVVSDRADWAACSLDGWDSVLSVPVECKHVGGMEPRETVIDRYQPQYHWQMICTNARETASSIIEAARYPVIDMIPWDEEYGEELWSRAEWLMWHIKNLVCPVDVPAAVFAPPLIVDMSASNGWAVNAALWLEHYPLARAADAELKALMPAAASKAQAHGVGVNRDKLNRLTVRATRR